MPYYSSVANNYEDLRTGLFSACTANGWSLSTDVLTKGTLALQVKVITTAGASDGEGVVLQGGTSATGATLVNPSLNRARLGPISTSGNAVTWPVTYEIFLFDDPDEVYLVLNTNVDQYLWLAFGKSTVPGIGLWFDATTCLNKLSAGPNLVSLVISSGVGGNPSSSVSVALFSATAQTATGVQYNKDSMHIDLDGVIWGGNPATNQWDAPYAFNALKYCYNLLTLLPNAWNGEGVFVRIRPGMGRAGNKWSVVADLQHARYVRVDNYDPGQVVTLGPDVWKIFPFYRKNTTSRNGGTGINHSGTFGWAIRYDGPV